MVISIRKLIKPTIVIILIFILFLTLWTILINKSNKYFMGGYVYTENWTEQEFPQPVFNGVAKKNEEVERFQRPSKQPALKLKYVYSHNEENFASQNPLNQKIFNSPEDVIHAYFAFLEQAENMDDYCGGCGTIGYAKEPFPHAYNLLTNELKQKMTLDEYIASFSGIGHTTLLKLIPVYQPPDTPKNIKYYMVEFEIITAPKCNEVYGNKPQPTHFAYYYGLITTEFKPSTGWKIKAVDYIPEDFLCAPYHLWHWDATYVVQIIFGEWYKLIEEIEKVDIEGSNIKIYAQGNQKRYRFDAIRLTNGTDIILHEYVWENSNWKEVDYIVEKHKYLKFSIWKIQYIQRNRHLEQ